MSKLKNAYPSPPGHPGKYVLYFSRRHRDDPDGNQMHVLIWATRYAAKKCLDILFEQDGLVWEGETIIRTESGIIVKCDLLQSIMSHEYDVKEMAWQPDAHHLKEIKAIRYKRQPTSIAPVERRLPGERKNRTARAPRPGGMTSIGDIAAALNFIPRECRAVLRKAKIQKPAYGWAWPADKVDEIKALLTKELGS